MSRYVPGVATEYSVTSVSDVIGAHPITSLTVDATKAIRLKPPCEFVQARRDFDRSVVCIRRMSSG